MKAGAWIQWQPVASVKRRGPHSFTCKLLNWWYCAHCGLMTLRNEATRLAMRRQCEWEEEA